MANRKGRPEDPSRRRNSHRSEEPVHKSAVANFITHGHANVGCVGMYYGRRKRPAEEEIDIVKEKIASFKKIRRLKTISELMADLKAKSSVDPPTSVNGVASKYKHTPPPEEQERKAKAFYSCMPTSHTRLKIFRRTLPSPGNKYCMDEEMLQKASSLKYLSSSRNNKLQENIFQSNQASHPFTSRVYFRQPSTKNNSPRGFSTDEDQMHQYSSPKRVHTPSPRKNNMSQELPIVDSQVSQSTDNIPEKLPLVERTVAEIASQSTSTDGMPMKPAVLKDNISQKTSLLKDIPNRESPPANGGSSPGPSVVNNGDSPKDQPTEVDTAPQETHSNATLKIYCDYMNKIGVQETEGVTGNYCFKDNVFREWHEGLYKPTYGGELLEILPYSVMD